MANKKRECKFCKLKFEPKSGKQKFCTAECRVKYNNSRRIYSGRVYEKKKKPKKLKADKPLTLAEVNARAREMGLHYGEYVRLYM